MIADLTILLIYWTTSCKLKKSVLASMLLTCITIMNYGLEVTIHLLINVKKCTNMEVSTVAQLAIWLVYIHAEGCSYIIVK